MEKLTFWILVFAFVFTLKTSAKFGPAIEFKFTVPTDYNSAIVIDVSAKMLKVDKTTYDWNSNLTSSNFKKVTDLLIPGKTYLVKVFPNASEDMVNSEACMELIRNEKSLMISAQGVAIIGSIAKNLLPKNKIIAFFDKKENLWQDPSSSMSHSVPFILAYGDDGKYSFGLRYFEYNWPANTCVICVYEI